MAILIFLSSCHPARKLHKDQYILEKVVLEGYKKSTKLSEEEFVAFYKQKPNRKFFRKFFGGLHFFVGWYNMFNDAKIQAKKDKRNEGYDVKNAKRIQKVNKKNIEREKKGKKPKVPKLLNKEEPTTLENLRNIGEAPVVFDSILANQTARQLRMFLFSKGYFNNRVDWCVDWNKGQKAELHFMLTPGEPYVIDHFTYTLEDTKIGTVFYPDTVNTLIKRGENYDAGILNEERLRITRFLLNNGYYFFESAFVNYNVDSSMAGNNVSVELVLRKFARTYSNSDDSVIYVNHTKFRINQIYVVTEPVLGNIRELQWQDTTVPENKDVKFLHNRPLRYKPVLLADFIKLEKGAIFIRDTAEATFKSLLGLGIFKGVTIQFFKSDEFPARLDCYIICTPLIKQSITLETEVVNTNNNRGIDGSLIYRNKNLFKGGEVIQLKLQGALTAQNQLGQEKEDPNLLTLTRVQQLFNTFQIGPEFTFSVPRAFFPFSLFPFKNEMLPRTYFKTSVNYQATANYVRNILDFEYGLTFRSKNRLFKYEIAPFEIYSVKANLTSAFTSSLQNLNDAFLINSFVDHITTLSKVGVVYSSKENMLTSTTPVHYVRVLGMSSGNILREFYNLRGAPKDTAGSYNIFGVPFAHFLKAELEYRIYIPLGGKRKLVYRVAGGIGKTLANLSVLPYEQSFFSGGPNTVRAWRARTLGPGGYDPTNSSTRFDKIGDLLLEGNIEYRFPILGSFYGAVFGDAGNIWRLQKVDDKPNGEFKVDEFYKQIALGGGVGIRWDLDFLILRFDFAIPIKDPKYAEGDRWTYDKRPWRQTVINFGIGYPF